MKIIFTITFIAIIWLLPEKGNAQKTESPEAVFSKAVEAVLVNSCLRKQNFGIKIHSLERNKTLYSIHSDRLFSPASNVKLLTTAMALKRLGPDYRFKTGLYATMPIDDKILRGDISIKGFGDPNLVSEQMWLLVNELKNLPLRKIHGDIIADESFFDDNLRVKTWKKKWGVEAYNAPLGALSFNFNTVTVYVTPGGKPGDRPVVVVDPDIEFIRVDNRARTVSTNTIGEKVNVLYVKGSGWDLDTLEPPGLPGVQLDHLVKLRKLDCLNDENMVNEQRTHLLDAASPNPSVETLLHAFLPHKFIDHSHADAILVIADQPNAKSLCENIYGDTMGIVPYIMPGFDLAKAAAEVYEKNPKVKGLVLISHGLFTFGSTAKESYDRHIEAVQQAEDFIASYGKKKLSPINAKITSDAGEMLSSIGPCLRGLFSEETGQNWLIHYREDSAACAFASSLECKDWSQIGTATPDHVIRTKQKPLLLNPKHLNDPEKLRKEISGALEEYKNNYHKYFKINAQSKGVDKKELDPLPRIILVAGLGLVTIGKSVRETEIAADIYQHTIDIIKKSFDIGQFAPLKDNDLFDMEYWSLEQAKLGKNKPAVAQGKIVYITGAASGIGLATAKLFAENGASLFLVDLDQETLVSEVEKLREQFKTGIAFQVVDVTAEKEVKKSFKYLTKIFGGLDILISNAGNAIRGKIGEVDSATLRKSFELNFFAHQTLASQAVQLFQKQKTGGVLMFNASKAAFNPGKDFGPYALPKAGVIALMKQYAVDYGKDGIRSNAVNADRIRTKLFTKEVLAERSTARGLTPDEYFKSNLLETEVFDTDVAKGFFDTALAEKTTGSVIVVDGGNIAASPR